MLKPVGALPILYAFILLITLSFVNFCTAWRSNIGETRKRKGPQKKNHKKKSVEITLTYTGEMKLGESIKF